MEPLIQSTTTSGSEQHHAVTYDLTSYYNWSMVDGNESRYSNGSQLEHGRGDGETAGTLDVNSIELIAIATALFSIILSVGIIGNASVIWLICVYRSMRQAVMNLYILNMAVSDLVLNLLGAIEVVQFAMDDGWKLGLVACKGLRYGMVSCLYVSILSLLAVAVERFVAILYPMQAHALLTKRRIMVATASIWISSLICASPTAIYNITIIMGDRKVYCIQALAKDKATSDKRRLVLKFIEFTIFFAIPLVIQIVLYLMITKKLRQSTARLKVSIDNGNSQNSMLNSNHNAGAPDSSTPLNTSSRQTSNDTWKTSNTVKSRRHVIKMLLACVIVYSVSYTPAQILLFHETFSKTPFHITWLMRAILLTLTFINSAANPIIYCICSETYRSRFKVMYGCDKEQTRRARRLKSSLRSGGSLRTVQTSSFRMSMHTQEAITEAKELSHLQPVTVHQESQI